MATAYREFATLIQPADRSIEPLECALQSITADRIDHRFAPLHRRLSLLFVANTETFADLHESFRDHKEWSIVMPGGETAWMMLTALNVSEVYRESIQIDLEGILIPEPVVYLEMQPLACFCIGGVLNGQIHTASATRFRHQGERYRLTSFVPESGPHVQFWVVGNLPTGEFESRAQELYLDAAVLRDEYLSSVG
jgi:hypothetical protein